jgi:tetratricopeptide (TPR) repeat protein
MNPQQWAALEALFDRLVEVTAGAREAWLDRHAPALDPLARQRVLALVARADEDTAACLGAPRELHAETPALAIGATIGGWRIAAVLGEGGQGRVYKVMRSGEGFEQQGVAKIVHRADPDSVRRFLRERQLLARLAHPAIPSLIEGGVLPDGRPWWVGEYIEGERSDQYVAARRLGPRATVELVLPIVDALVHAHGRLILHRDLKPSNVLVDGAGRAHLLDFGIGQRLDDEATRTQAAFSAGYAAPEQVRGEVPGVAVDVHGLGALLYRLLAGKAPFAAEDTASSLHAVLHRDPPRIAGVDRELWAILAKALRKEPAARYADIASLGEDLQAWLDRRPVRALAGGRRYVIGKFLARHRLAAGSVALALLAILGSSAVAVREAGRSEAARVVAEEALAQSEWDLSQYKLFSAYQEAYAATLQDLVLGADGLDPAALAQAMERAGRAALASAEADPEGAAYRLYAISRHFVFGQDYPRAIAILEPWLAQGFGAPEVLTHARGLLARALMDSERQAEAAELLRSIEATQRESRLRHTPEHAASASQLALSTEQEADLAHADDVLRATLANTRAATGTEDYLLNQIGMVATRRGRFEEALAAFEQAHALAFPASVRDRVGIDQRQLNLASYRLFHGGDIEGTRALIGDAIDDPDVLAGRRPTDGRLIELRAWLARFERRLDEARRGYEAALALYAGQRGEDTLPWLGALAARAEVRALLGDREGALADLERLRAGVALPGREGVATRLALAEAQIALTLGEPARAQALLDDPTLRERVRRNVQLHDLHRRMLDSIKDGGEGS